MNREIGTKMEMEEKQETRSEDFAIRSEILHLGHVSRVLLLGLLEMHE